MVSTKKRGDCLDPSEVSHHEYPHIEGLTNPKPDKRRLHRKQGSSGDQQKLRSRDICTERSKTVKIEGKEGE